MEKRYKFNDHGVCTNPDLVWNGKDGQVTIKVWVARYEKKWLHGYQFSIYTMDKEATSNLVLPSINKKMLLSENKKMASRIAVEQIEALIQESIKIEYRMAFVPVIKTFRNLFFNNNHE